MLIKKRLCKLFFKVLLLVVVIVSANESFETAWSAQVEPDSIVLTWTDDSRTTQAITWQTAATALDQIQYTQAGVRKDFSANARTTIATKTYIPGHEDAAAIFSALLTDLKPGTCYFYRIGNGETWSEVHSFRTAANDVNQFKFLVFGDSQSESYNSWQKNLHQAYQAHPDAVFFTNVGDLVNVGNDFKEWQSWFAAAKGIIDTIPAMPLTGNHEMYTPQWKVNELPAIFTAQFQLPLNGPGELKEQVYSFDYGNVHFAMLNSQEKEIKQFIPDMLKKQQDWLEKDLSLTTKPWKVVFLHRPPYHSKSARDNDKIREAFVPILDKHQVDVVFSGHEHIFARTYPLYAHNRVGQTDQGTVYITTGRSGTKVYDRAAAANTWDEVLYNPIDQPNYLTVQVNENTLTVKAWKQTGELIDEWHTNKSAPARLGIAH